MNHDSINSFLSNLVERSVLDLEASYCLEIGEDNSSLTPTTLGMNMNASKSSEDRFMETREE